MFGVECFDTHDEPISHYTQWDINQTLKIVLYGMDDGYVKNAPYVHFANIKSSEALVVRSTLQGDDTVLVDIPNQLLQEPYPLLIYVYLNDSSDASSQRTIVKIEIPVQKRAKPSDYEYVENIDRVTAEVIKQEIYDDFMDEVSSGNLAYPYVTFIDESTGKHVNLKVSDEKFGLYVDSTNRQLLDTGDIVNNLMTNDSSKVLSASMGTTLKNMVDVIPNQIDEKINMHDSSSSAHSDIRGDISDVSNMVDTMQNEVAEVQSSIVELEGKLDDVGSGLDGSMSGNDVLTTTEALVGSTPIEMRIQGNTVQNLWVNPIKTQNGVAITESDDGGITVTGTTTATTTVMTDAIYTMRPSTTYSIGADKMTNAAGFVFSVYQYNSENGLLAGSDSITNTSKGRTITTNAQMAYVKFVVVIPSGTTVSETYHVMLNEGEELKPWCKSGLNSVDEVGIVTAGKNLLTNSLEGSAPTIASMPTTLIDFGKDVRLSGVTLSVIADTVLEYKFDNSAFVDFLESNGTHHYVTVNSVLGKSGSTTAGMKRVITIPDVAFRQINCFLTSDGFAIFDPSCRVRLQLELGSTATAYETPTVTTTALPKVELRSLPNGTCDELVIKGDGTCEVERRTAKIVLNGSEEQTINSQITATHGGFYFNIVFDMPDNADGVSFSSASQVTDKLQIGNGDAFSNVVGVFANGSTHKTDARISVDGIETVEALKTYLQSNPVTLVYTIKDDSTEPQSSVTLSSFPSDKSNIYTTSNVPVTSLTVRYWKKSGELVKNLYDKLAQLQGTINSIQGAVTQS